MVNTVQMVILRTMLGVAACLTCEGAWAQCELSKHQADVPAVGDDFGAAVAVDGTVMVVGAPENDAVAGSSGAAYIFRFDGQFWMQEQMLTASDADSGDDYGYSVAVSGDTVVVGANRDDLPGLSRAGSAYVYRFNGVTWEEEDHLTASDAQADDRFGSSAAIDGDTLVVGATHEDTIITNAGAGYVFVRNGTEWTQQDKLTAELPTGTNPHLGRSASIDGEVVVLGAWQDSAKGMFSVGAAYVFRRDGVNWNEEQKLTASDAADFSLFGQSVSISGDVIAVGAPREQAEAPSDSGAAYFYAWNGADWDEEDKVKASDVTANDRFGWSIALDGDDAVVGTDTSASKAYLFSFSAGAWAEQAMLNSADRDVSAEYAYAVALRGGTAVVGDRNGAAGTGLAFVFEIPGADCNDNGLCDRRDIAEETSDDANGDGIPDECVDQCPTDLDDDGDVDSADLAELLASWGPCAGCPADFDDDGDVDSADLADLLAAWGPCL